jgi:hypothetical protein
LPPESWHPENGLDDEPTNRFGLTFAWVAVFWHGEGAAAGKFAEAEKLLSLAVSVSPFAERVNGTDRQTSAARGTFRRLCNTPPPLSHIDGAAEKKDRCRDGSLCAFYEMHARRKQLTDAGFARCAIIQ